MGHAKSVTLIPFHGIELPGYWVACCHLRVFSPTKRTPHSVVLFLIQFLPLAISDNGLEGKILGLTTLHTLKSCMCVLQRSIDIMSGDGDSNHCFCHWSDSFPNPWRMPVLQSLLWYNIYNNLAWHISCSLSHQNTCKLPCYCFLLPWTQVNHIQPKSLLQPYLCSLSSK